MSYKNLSRNRTYRLSTPVRLGVAAVAACFLAAPVLSNPVNPTVVNGTATFNQAGNVLTVTNSNGAIINWDKFSIAAGEKTHFAQSSASSSVLNRVLNDPSAIYGTLSSNGRVWLINPAGIMVGAGGRVDTAAFVASTLNIRNEDFLAGRHLFINDGTGKDVINQGEIITPAGGSVYLIGSNVANEGIITTPKGETILAAGATVSLIDSALPGVKVDITGATGNATNLGTITAEAGRIGIAGVIVRNSGTLNASSVVEEGGRIFLKASQDAYVDGSGRIVTTGTKGGSVEVLGNRVAVMDHASIDASATTEGGDGGRILVGGDYQGKNPDIQNATITYFGPDATLKADAGKVGDGGTVIVWADDTTRAYGHISARGGANGGDGGFVETSGKNYLDFDAKVDTRAPNGSFGTLLLDPDQMLVTDVVGSDINIYGGGSFFQPMSVGPSTLHWSQIATALSSTSISINGGDIFFNQSAPWSFTANSNSLGFYASGMISGNWGYSGPNTQPTTGLYLTTAGNITFQANGNIHLGNGSIVTGGSGGVTSLNGSVGIGYFKTVTGMTVSAKYSIWDDNWQTPGAINIESNGYINLSSAYGADPFSTCTSSTWCSAIQADTAGLPTLITATVQSNATSGGIGIRHHGTLPSSVSLYDYSTNPAHNEVGLHATGDINLGAGHTLRSNGGGIYVEAGGNMTIAGATFYGGPSELAFFAGGNLTVNQNLTTSPAGSFLGFAAGSMITVNNPLVSGGDIAMIAGINKASLETIDDNPTVSNSLANQFVALLTNSGTINVNANVTAADFVGIVANTVNITGAAVTGTAGAAVVGAFQDLTLSNATVRGPDAFLFAGGDIRVNNGSLVYATSDSVYLGLLGSDSTLYINDTAGMSTSKIHAYSPTTINIGFLSRSSGGIVIDGTETTTTVAGGSGFYVGASPVPATAGSGLQLAYANTGVTDICASSSDLCNPKPPAGNPIDEPPPTFEIVGPGGTRPADDPSKVVGGTEGSFGGEEGKDEKKDEKDEKDKKSDQAKDEKKDEKSAQKKVAQCSS